MVNPKGDPGKHHDENTLGTLWEYFGNTLGIIWKYYSKMNLPRATLALVASWLNPKGHPEKHHHENTLGILWE
jgi:hypothetical protein